MEPEGQAEIVSCTPKWCDPPMPTLIPGDLRDWMQERHGVLQDAMNVGNSGKIFELTSMLSNVAEMMAEMTGGMTMTS